MRIWGREESPVSLQFRAIFYDSLKRNPIPAATRGLLGGQVPKSASKLPPQRGIKPARSRNQILWARHARLRDARCVCFALRSLFRKPRCDMSRVRSQDSSSPIRTRLQFSSIFVPDFRQSVPDFRQNSAKCKSQMQKRKAPAGQLDRRARSPRQVTDARDSGCRRNCTDPHPPIARAGGRQRPPLPTVPPRFSPDTHAQVPAANIFIYICICVRVSAKCTRRYYIGLSYAMLAPKHAVLGN